MSIRFIFGAFFCATIASTPAAGFVIDGSSNDPGGPRASMAHKDDCTISLPSATDSPGTGARDRSDHSSVYLSGADYVYVRDESTSRHEITDLALVADSLIGQANESMEWRPSCGDNRLSLAPGDAISKSAMLIVLLIASLSIFYLGKHQASRTSR